MCATWYHRHTMTTYPIMFWSGFVVLVLIHVAQLIGLDMPTTPHALISLAGTAAMFVGSKIGREFLGIKA